MLFLFIANLLPTRWQPTFTTSKEAIHLSTAHRDWIKWQDCDCIILLLKRREPKNYSVSVTNMFLFRVAIGLGSLWLNCSALLVLYWEPITYNHFLPSIKSDFIPPVPIWLRIDWLNSPYTLAPLLPCPDLQWPKPLFFSEMNFT